MYNLNPMQNNNHTTVSFHTIGCRLNQYETAVLRNSFENKGFSIVSSDAPADIVVINTCTVTEKSDTDTRQYINKMIRRNAAVKIALVGCQVQLQKDVLKQLPHVHWVIGNKRKFDLPSIIKDSDHPMILVPAMGKPESFKMETFGIDTEHTRANLKIQDGCDNFCTYCEVPFARGRARSREFDDIVKEAHVLAEAGHKEIILTGINVGKYQDKKRTIVDVVKVLEGVPKLKRIRISSIEPTNILDSLIDYMAKKTKLCRYLHIPIQHGNDAILKLMARKYNVEQVKDLILKAHETIPDICIGTDIIVGFPGETDSQFEETYKLLKQIPVNYFHVFSFSKRNMAKAKEYAGQVSISEIQQRSAKLRGLGQRKRRQFYEQMIGKKVSVLFEQAKEGQWQGLTDNFIQVHVSSIKDLNNQIHLVQLKHVHGQAIHGQLIEKD